MRFLVNFPKDQPKARTRKQHNFSPDRPDIAEFKTKANSAIFITFHHFHRAEDLRKIGIHTSVMAGKSGLWRTRKSPRQRISNQSEFDGFITFHHFHRHAADSMRSSARLIFILSLGEPGGTRTRDPLIKSLREPLPLFATGVHYSVT